jgi:hypothetical protein
MLCSVIDDAGLMGSGRLPRLPVATDITGTFDPPLRRKSVCGRQ